MIHLPGYRTTESLYASTHTLVYRGVRQRDRQPVVIKVPRNPFPSFSELVQFRNQFTIAKNLNIPGIVTPYSLEPYHSGYALIMEDFGGISLRDYAQDHALSLREILTIGQQLAKILHDLHQARVIHKDIHPASHKTILAAANEVLKVETTNIFPPLLPPMYVVCKARKRI